MKACDVYVQPSKYEGKALTVVEAQILSKPVLITNYPTAKSQIENNTDGLICSMDAEGLIGGIERLYEADELRQSLQFNCLQKNYSNTQELNKLYQLIDGDSNMVGSLPHERVREVL
ncbi:putative glycosyltransferase [Bacillus sp. TS-2]|nr:putative glycosyltransferase [Bacillus sp. TS-2]